MSIPIQNLYHLLTYAWDQLDEAEEVAVTAEPADSMLELLARVLVQGTTHVLKHGLARDYMPEVELTGRLRGKLLLSESVRQQTLLTARGWCAFDELSHDVPVNRLLKSALHHLLTVQQLNKSLRREIRGLYVRLADVALIAVPNIRVYDQVVLHRHTAHYRLLLRVCQLVHEEVLLTQKTGERLFRNFTGNDKRMAVLFERFVRNFYWRRQKTYKVGSEKLKWAVRPATNEAEALLPIMQTDVSLTSPAHKIIMDCKYYRKALKQNYNQEKIISAHLYQLFAYVQHAQRQEPTRPVDGLLLYPVVDGKLRHSYQLLDSTHRLRVATVNLDQCWQAVEAELHSLLEW